MENNFPLLNDDNYQIESILGSGGGGIVYKAWHMRLQKYVALKRVSDSKQPVASRAEVDMLKNLKHTGLPQVYDFLTDDSGVYTVMEFIPGRSFSQLLSAGQRFSQKQVIKWAQDLSGALAYLHGRNPPILHSDIKPANIMLTPEGEVCLIDFNVSLMLNGADVEVVGRSHGYASPEQYGPEALPRSLRIVPANTEQININDTESLFVPVPQMSSSARERTAIRMDTRSDIYSLGATLYHMLTGEKPAIASGEVKPIGAYQLGLGDAIVYIIEKCMERDSAKRFQTAAELHRAFRDIRKLDSRWKRQNLYKNIAIAVLAVLFVASGASAAYGWIRMGNERVAAFNELVHQIPSALTDEPFQQAVSIFPDRIEAHRAQALRLHTQGFFEESTQFINEIMAHFSAFSWSSDELLIIGDIFYIEGNAWFELGNYPRAVAAYEAAVLNNPTNPEMFRDYAIALARVGLVYRAEELLTEIQGMIIGDDSVQLLQGEIAYAVGNFETAVTLFHQVIRTSNNPFIRQRAYLICERAYRRLPNRTADRIILLRNALTELPSVYQPVIKERLADALVQMGGVSENPDIYYSEAILMFNELRARGNISFITAQNIGLLYQRMGNFASARLIYTELVESFPNDYRPLMRLAFLVLEEQAALSVNERDYAEVLEWYGRSRDLYNRRPVGAGDDMEMLILERLIEELRQQGWL